VSREVPVPRWPLSELGRQRMRAGLRQPWVKDIRAIYCSTEQKAIDGAEILASHLALPFHQIQELGENDRSATGFLPPDEFEGVADVFRFTRNIGTRMGACSRRAKAHRACSPPNSAMRRPDRHRLSRRGRHPALLPPRRRADRAPLGPAAEGRR
jgi:hypothetical protein